jgi:hypothetical protein
MADRPILFSAPMVRALLAGTKTQTRRVANGVVALHSRTGEALAKPDSAGPRVACPYGQPGERLWVREAWAAHWMYNDLPPSAARSEREDLRAGDNRWYRADGEHAPSQLGTTPNGLRGKWRAGMFMPRWASRFSLEVKGVRVERLQHITRGDAMAEGCTFANMAKGSDPREWYRELWTTINGPDSWAANPWVWVVEFKRVKGGPR